MENHVQMVRFHIEVGQKGEVEIRGFAESAEEKAQILKTIEAVKGVSKVQGDIGVIRHTF